MKVPGIVMFARTFSHSKRHFRNLHSWRKPAAVSEIPLDPSRLHFLLVGGVLGSIASHRDGTSSRASSATGPHSAHDVVGGSRHRPRARRGRARGEDGEAAQARGGEEGEEGSRGCEESGEARGEAGSRPARRDHHRRGGAASPRRARAPLGDAGTCHAVFDPPPGWSKGLGDRSGLPPTTRPPIIATRASPRVIFSLL